MANRNQLVVPDSQRALDQLKAEVASELGIQIGADQTARANGAVGGKMVKRLIQIAESTMTNKK